MKYIICICYQHRQKGLRDRYFSQAEWVTDKVTSMRGDASEFASIPEAIKALNENPQVLEETRGYYVLDMKIIRADLLDEQLRHRR